MPPCPYPPSAPTPRLPDEPGDHDGPLPGLTATPHRHNPYPDPRTPALPPTATITLHRTTAGTLTGHASGARHQWAETCLTLAGFTADQYGIHQLPLDDPSQAREALHQLRQSAQDLDVAVILSERPFLGDVADRIAHALPGRWTVMVTAHPERHAQQGLLESVWASGPSGGALHKALETPRPPGMSPTRWPSRAPTAPGFLGASPYRCATGSRDRSSPPPLLLQGVLRGHCWYTRLSERAERRVR